MGNFCSIPGLASLAVGLSIASGVWASAVPITAAEATKRISQTADLLERTVAEIAPGLMFGMPEPTDQRDVPVCDAQRPARTMAVLVGIIDSTGRPQNQYKGTENEVALIASTLERLGVEPEHIYRLTGAEISREHLASRLTQVIEELNCGDRLFLQIASLGFSTAEASFRPSLLWQPFREEPPQESVTTQSLAEEWQALARELQLASDPDADWRDTMLAVLDTYGNIGALEADEPFASLSPEARSLWGRLLLFTNPEGRDLFLGLSRPHHAGLEGWMGAELAATLLAVRQRGATAIVLMDTPTAASAQVIERHMEGRGLWWQADGFAMEGRLSVQETGKADLAGGLIVLYSSAPDALSSELRLPRGDPDAEIFAPFTYLVAAALRDRPGITARELAKQVEENAPALVGERSLRSFMRFRIQATDPDLSLLGAGVGTVPVGDGDTTIRILSPAPTRGGGSLGGALAIASEQVAIEGVVDWRSPVIGLFVNDTLQSFEPSGRFQVEVPLTVGLNRVTVNAITADARLHHTALEFTYQGDRAALEGNGRRFAVLIANQNYAPATAFSSLATPMRDISAIGEILIQRFGFETEIMFRGEPMPLVLVDPGQRDIVVTLNALASVAGPRDEVLVFYAGHGVSDTRLGSAAWVPADALAGFPDTFLTSAQLSGLFSRFDTRNLIVIADSCYAGGLFRSGDGGVAELMARDETRMQSLLRQQARKSRILITSGNDEPVLDGGGEGHSVFARALLIGLGDMAEEAFSARELFDRYLRLQVSGITGQEPQFRELLDIGHEGGDFVFVSADR
jgi:hypothetical protein